MELLVVLLLLLELLVSVLELLLLLEVLLELLEVEELVQVVDLGSELQNAKENALFEPFRAVSTLFSGQTPLKTIENTQEI